MKPAGWPLKTFFLHWHVLGENSSMKIIVREKSPPFFGDTRAEVVCAVMSTPSILFGPTPRTAGNSESPSFSRRDKESEQHLRSKDGRRRTWSKTRSRKERTNKETRAFIGARHVMRPISSYHSNQVLVHTNTARRYSDAERAPLNGITLSCVCICICI